MTVEIKKVITRDIALEFKNATSVNIFYIDNNNNLQYSPHRVNDFLIMSDFLVEVGHISDIKLKHIKNMIKFPDIVNIEEVFDYDGEILDIQPVVGFLLNAIYLVNIDGKRNWIYMSGEHLEKNKTDEDWYDSETRKYQISSHVAK
jgi:hypothetical protein